MKPIQGLSAQKSSITGLFCFPTKQQHESLSAKSHNPRTVGDFLHQSFVALKNMHQNAPTDFFGASFRNTSKGNKKRRRKLPSDGVFYSFPVFIFDFP